MAASDRGYRPVVFLGLALALLGAAAPVAALLKGGGLRGSLNDAALMLGFWGISPFVLVPVAAWLAQRPFTRGAVLVLSSVACLFGLLGHFAGMVPPVPNASDSLAFIFIPVWQWPMILLATLVALVVPSARQEADSGSTTP
jgi:hypothetical protein